MALPAEFVPADLTYEVEPGKSVPVAEHPFIKDSPDVPTFFKRVLDTHREVGARIPIKIERVRNSDGTFGPKVESLEQWRKDHMPKLYDAGVLDRPPSKPEEYEIKKPEELTAGTEWSDERASKFANVGIKHGISKAAMGELLALHREAVSGTATIFNNTYDQLTLDLKKEYGDKYEERLEQAKRLNNYIFRKPEELAFMEKTGLGNHPIFVGILMRLAPLAQNDSTLVESMKAEGGGAPVSAETLEAEREKIRGEIAEAMSDPKHPMYNDYLRQSAKWEAWNNEKYQALYGKGKVEIGAGSGITIVPSSA